MEYNTIVKASVYEFEITGGLLEGYDYANGYVHSLEEVVHAHQRWQERNLIIQGVHIYETTISYGTPKQGDQIAVTSASEAGFIISGIINPLYEVGLTYLQAEERVLSLAKWVGGVLGQTRVYVVFSGVLHILEAQQTEVDDGETVAVAAYPHKRVSKR